MLFYVQRTPGKVLKFSDPNGVPLQSTLMTSRLWQAAADGSHPIMLVSEPAFGLASISYQAATKTLIYSRVDTVARQWAHRLSNGRYTAALLKKYGPRVSVEQLPLGGTPTTQVANAGRPMLQP